MIDDFSLDLKQIKKEKIHKIITNQYFSFVVISLLLLVLTLSIGSALPSINRDIGKIIIFSIASLGLSILLGHSGLVSLATAGFMGIGGYAFGYIINATQLPFSIAMLLAILLAVIVGLIIGVISLRVEGIYLAIITLGFSEIIIGLFKNLTSITRGVYTFTIITPRHFDFSILNIFTSFEMTSKTGEMIMISVIIFFLLALLILIHNIINSPIGRAMQTIKNNETLASSYGINKFKYRLFAFILAVIYASIGGVLYMAFLNSTEPSIWNIALTINILAAVVLGGSKSIWGILVGGVVIFGIDIFIFQNIAYFQNRPEASMIFSGILIVVVFLFYPGGLTRLYSDIKASYIKLKKRRKEYFYGKD